MSRHFWVLVHRYAGLYMAFFLIVAGLTGSILAFYHELQDWLNPPDRVAVLAKPMLDPFELRERALALEPNMYVSGLNLHPQPGEVFTVGYEPRINPETGKPYAIKPISLNPYSGERLDLQAEKQGMEAAAGYWPLTRKNILPFIYKLHYSLALNELGVWLFGIAAIIWTVDSFVGFYLTLPVRRKKSAIIAPPFQASHFKARPPEIAHRSYWQRWWLAWTIKWPSSTPRLNFDLHRAGGLWTWLMLLVLAWSSVLLNLKTEFYMPVMKQFVEMTDLTNYPIPDLSEPIFDPALDFTSAYQIGKQLMAEQAQKKGFKVLQEQGFQYLDTKGLYVYDVRTDLNPGTMGANALFFNANTGEFVALFLPTGQKAGDTIQVWLQTLHMAKIWGLPYKIFICFMGLVVTMLSVTGVYLWLKKRQAIRRKKAASSLPKYSQFTAPLVHLFRKNV